MSKIPGLFHRSLLCVALISCFSSTAFGAAGLNFPHDQDSLTIRSANRQDPSLSPDSGWVKLRSETDPRTIGFIQPMLVVIDGQSRALIKIASITVPNMPARNTGAPSGPLPYLDGEYFVVDDIATPIFVLNVTQGTEHQSVNGAKFSAYDLLDIFIDTDYQYALGQVDIDLKGKIITDPEALTTLDSRISTKTVKFLKTPSNPTFNLARANDSDTPMSPAVFHLDFADLFTNEFVVAWNLQVSGTRVNATSALLSSLPNSNWDLSSYLKNCAPYQQGTFACLNGQTLAFTLTPVIDVDVPPNLPFLSFTNPHTVQAELPLVVPPKVQLVLPKTFLTRTPTTIEARITDATTGAPLLLPEYETYFMFYPPGGGSPQVFRDVLTANYTAETSGVHRFEFIVKSKSAPEQQEDAATMLVKSLNFEVAKPKVQLRGIKYVQTGTTNTYSAAISPPWKLTDTTKKVDSQWLLNGDPVGTPNSPTFSFNPTPEATPSSTPRSNVLTHTAWIRGQETDTKVSTEFPLQVYDYLLPQMVLKEKLDASVSPSRFSLSLLPTNTDQARLMSGKRYTFEWTPPKNMTATAKGSMLYGTFDQPGVYPFQVLFKDNLGNQSVYTKEITLLTASDPVFNLVVKPLLPFERAPMSYSLRPTVTLGHPKDAIVSWVTEVDGVAQPSSRRPPTSVTGLQAGQHNIKVSFTTRMGVSASSEATVNVSPNQPALVALMGTPIAKSTLVKAQALVLKDPDGKIRTIQWTMDGVPLKKFGTSIIIDMAGKQESLVTLTATDDSGELTTTEMRLPGPPAGGKY